MWKGGNKNKQDTQFSQDNKRNENELLTCCIHSSPQFHYTNIFKY